MSTRIKADATGAVVLPAELCREAGVTPGAEVTAEIRDGRVVVAMAAVGPDLVDRIAALIADIPPEELDRLPADGAAQIDHYLYGHPKRPG